MIARLKLLNEDTDILSHKSLVINTQPSFLLMFITISEIALKLYKGHLIPKHLLRSGLMILD